MNKDAEASEVSETSEDPGSFFNVISRHYTDFDDDNIELEGIKGSVNGFKTNQCTSEILLQNKTRIDFFYNNAKDLLVITLPNEKVLNLDYKTIVDFLGSNKEMIEASLWDSKKSHVTQSASLYKVNEPVYQGNIIGKIKVKYEETIALEEPNTVQEVFSITATNYRDADLGYALIIRPLQMADQKLVVDKRIFKEPDLQVTVSHEENQELFFYTRPRHVLPEQPKKRKTIETPIIMGWVYGLYIDLREPVSDSENIIACSDGFVNLQTGAFKPAVLDKGSRIRPYKCDFTRKTKVDEDSFFRISYQKTNLYIRLEDILALNKVKTKWREIHSQKPYEQSEGTQTTGTEITLKEPIIDPTIPLKTPSILPRTLDT